MLDNTIKVYGEDLISTAFSVVPSGGATGNPITVGETQGALVVNIFAKSAVSLSADVTVNLTHSDAEGGTYTALTSATIASGSTAADGALIKSIVLPKETKAFIKATVASSQSNTGGLRIALGYLPR